MASNSAAYYDQDPRDAAGNAQPSAYRNIQQELKKAEEQLHSNIQNLSARGERLDNLQQKTDDLSTSAGQFRSGANRVRKQMWWKDMKMRMCIIIGIVLLLVVIIVPSVIASKHKS